MSLVVFIWPAPPRALLTLLHLLLVLGSVGLLGFAVQVPADPPDGKEAEP